MGTAILARIASESLPKRMTSFWFLAISVAIHAKGIGRLSKLVTF